MAEIYRAELAEAARRRSGGDLNAILHALEADGAISVVDDPKPETEKDEETGEETTTYYAVGPELAIKVDADEKAAKEAEAEAKKSESAEEKRERAEREKRESKS